MSARGTHLRPIVLAGTIALLFARNAGAAESETAPTRPDVPVAEAAPALLDSLLVEAWEASPRIHALESAWQAASLRAPQAGALPDPMLNYTAEGAPLKQPSPANAMNQRIELTQMLPFPGKQGLMKRSMEAEAEMAHAELDRGRLEVAADLTRAFYDLYLLHATSAVLEETEITLRSMAEVARTKYQVGTAMQQDFLKANVEVAREVNQRVITQARIPAAEARINAILGRPAGQPLGRPVLGDTTVAWPSVAALDSASVLVQPMLRVKNHAVEKRDFDLDLARKSGLPDFNIGAEYMGVKDAPDAWSLMLGMTLPVWRGNKVGPARQEAQASLTSAEADREQTRNEVRAMVRDAWTMMATSRTQVNLYRDSVLPQAEQSLASARAAYETNRAGFLDLLDAQRSLLASRLDYQMALTEYLKSRADLGLAVGDPRLLGVAQ